MYAVIMTKNKRKKNRTRQNYKKKKTKIYLSPSSVVTGDKDVRCVVYIINCTYFIQEPIFNNV